MASVLLHLFGISCGFVAGLFAAVARDEARADRRREYQDFWMDALQEARANCKPARPPELRRVK